MSEAYQGGSPNARLLAGALATSAPGGARLGNAFSVSLVTHLAIVAVVLFVITMPGIPSPANTANLIPRDIIWTVSPGPGGGGGGGGNKTPEPLERRSSPTRPR